MSYRLHSDESLEAGLRRIACEQLDLAVGGLEDASLDRHEAIHEARKCCKRLRGLLRLARASLGDNVYGAENASVRDAARRLSDLRERVPSWPLSGADFAALAPGLRRTYGRGRKAMRAAYDAPGSARFHDWRKRVKYHRYHLDLLHELWPRQLKGRRKEVKVLGTMLGEEHDLAVLRATLEPRRAAPVLRAPAPCSSWRGRGGPSCGPRYARSARGSSPSARRRCPGATAAIGAPGGARSRTAADDGK